MILHLHPPPFFFNYALALVPLIPGTCCAGRPSEPAGLGLVIWRSRINCIDYFDNLDPIGSARATIV